MLALREPSPGLPPHEMSHAEYLALTMARPDQEEFFRSLSDEELRALIHSWTFWARPKQLAPRGDWYVWMLRAGRGFGKTRAGGGWIHQRAMEVPHRWMALIGANPADVRDYMIEGPGGILRNTPPDERPYYEPSKRRLTWPNGSWATVYSAEKADHLRGFSGDTAWLDEMGKWKNPREVWDNLQFGMREPSSDQPRVCITTTPRPVPVLMEIEEQDTTYTTVGSSHENKANLDPRWFAKTIRAYEGTKFGRQEIYAEYLDDIDGRVYSEFSKKTWPEGNVDPTIEDLGGELLIGQDFNVNPMASVIAQRVVDECHVIDALEIDSSNSIEVANFLRRRYPNRSLILCPDPAGRARHTNAPAGQTDHTIFENAGFEIHSPTAAPPVRDRVNNSQAMFLQGRRRRTRIHPRAEPLIKALSNLTYKKGTSIRDKASGFDHVCDALDYLHWVEFNVIELEGESVEPFSWRP